VGVVFGWVLWVFYFGVGVWGGVLRVNYFFFGCWGFVGVGGGGV